MNRLQFLVIIALFIKVANTKFIVDYIDNCDNRDMFLDKVWISGLETKNGKQYIKYANASITEDIGKNGRYVAKLFTKNSRFPLRFNRANICEDIKPSLGELWVKVLKEVGIPEKCPIKKGYYTGKHIFLDVEKVPFVVPFTDTFFVVVNATDTKTKKPLVCLTAKVRNV